MRCISPSPLTCAAACLLVAFAWSGTSALVSRGALPTSRHSDVIVLLVCVTAYVLGTAGQAGSAGLPPRQPRPPSRVAEATGLEQVLERLDEVVQRGGRPDRVAINRALDACSKLGRVAQAQRLFEQMPGYGLAPNANTYGIMIMTYASGDMAREAVSLFEAMLGEGVEPSRQVYHELLHCCVKLQRLEDAVAVYNEMVRARVLPQDATCQRLSHACQKRGWCRIADQIAHDLARVQKTEILLDDSSEASTDFENTEADAESE